MQNPKGVNGVFETRVHSVNFLSVLIVLMKLKLYLLSLVCAGPVIGALGADTSTAPKESVFPTKPLGITVSVKMVCPYIEPADLQIICLFKHKPAGDTY